MNHLSLVSQFIEQADRTIDRIDELPVEVPKHLRAGFRIELARIEKRLAKLKKACNP